MIDLEREVRDALKELVAATGATSARITASTDERTGVPARTLPLGGGEFLRVELPTRSPAPRADDAIDTAERGHDIEAALDRCVRSLRASQRRWEAAHLPEVSVASDGIAAQPPPGARVLERIASFLQGLAASTSAPLADGQVASTGRPNAFVVVRGALLASAHPPDETSSSRWPFLARRVLATHAPHSSHGEVVDPDAYAMSFWYDAAIVVLLDEPFAIDFVRHRCRHVAREIANLLPLLEPDPQAPAMVRRRPPTGPIR
jgi:hypothetical protein